jgi:hypothetical protein
MERKYLLSAVVVAGLVAMLVAGCSLASIAPTPTPALTPTPVPSPTPVPGIDEPVLVGDVTVRVIDAYTEDKLSWDTGTVYPDDPSHTFFEVLADMEGTGGTEWNRFYGSIKLASDGEEYEMGHWGIKFDERGKLAGTLLVFSVPKESKFGRCTLRLSEEVSIELARFFEPAVEGNPE